MSRTRSVATEALPRPKRQAGLNVWASGLALYSMFFGAGNVVWPLIMGVSTGSQVGFAWTGLILTAVVGPLIGLLAIMLFEGNYRSFFGRIGLIPGLILLFVVQAVMGPVGAIPRLITLSHASAQTFLPLLSLPTFSLVVCLLLFGMMFYHRQIVAILGYLLTPILLVCLALIIGLGIFHAPPLAAVKLGPLQAFGKGFGIGYNTLDLVTSFLFGHLVYIHFRTHNQSGDPKQDRRNIVIQYLKASGIAAVLLCITYAGLSYLSAAYAADLANAGAAETWLGSLALRILGPYGGLVAAIAVAMACLTTALSLIAICADYIRNDLSRQKVSFMVGAGIALLISGLLANLGFAGIANLLTPILRLSVPALLVFSLLNIGNRLYGIKIVKTPVAIAFTFSVIWELLL